jgi:hypothetical protein
LCFLAEVLQHFVAAHIGQAKVEDHHLIFIEVAEF